MKMKNINCYIHIPFCTSKCKYCRFASFWWLKEIQIITYINFLCKEIESKKNKNYTLDTIYFWWWTPWVLSKKQFKQILDSLKESFNLSENIEISIESTPENINEKNIVDWKEVWINRLSMGIQSLNQSTLEEIWRSWKWDIISALDSIDNVWFPNVSIDFILGLPFVKKGETKNDINYILNKYTFIKHISIYMLEEYYDIPEDLDSKFENITYPDNWSKDWLSEDDYLNDYININSYLSDKWFNRYEISNYSKMWFECQHNVWYWNHKESLAFWLGAFWFIDNTRFSNSEDFLEYYSYKNIESEKLNMNDLFIENLMFRLRTDGIEIEKISTLNKKKINEFIQNWFLINKSNKIILSNKWILVMDYILSEIM